jgi:hypothetical protein
MADEHDLGVPEVPAIAPVVEPPVAPQQDAIPVDKLAGALVSAYTQITGANQPRPQAPQDPIDSLSPQQREQLNRMFIEDPVQASKYIQDLTRQQMQQQIMQQALPMYQTTANQIVELFKMRKQQSDPYFAQVAPGFDRLMVGIDITPLVNMNDPTRTQELEMRWKMARADVLDMEMRKNQKAEPKLLSNNGGPGTGPKSSAIRDDEWMANMAREYGFTEEQLAEIEARNG